MEVKKTISHGAIFISALFLVLFIENYDLGITLHMILYLVVARAVLRSMVKPDVRSKRTAFFMFVYYSVLMSLLYFLMLSDFSNQSRFSVAIFLFFLFVGEQLMTQKRLQYCVSTTLDEDTLSFEDLRSFKHRLAYRKTKLKEVGEKVTFSFIKEIMTDFPRNCTLRYVAKGSLSPEYFHNLEKSLDDPYVYLVFSDTGSAASNLIGMFTQKPYNHISISFDDELKTLVSYNGGERLSPPGLNPEMLEWFYRKEDASIRLYRLKVTFEQKKAMAERVAKINEEGSAYNLLGAALGKSIQPNMMICSEFVYSLLQSVGAEYFQKTALEVKPSDLIELDYERKLEFVEAIALSSFCQEMVIEGQPLPQGGKPYVTGEKRATG